MTMTMTIRIRKTLNKLGIHQNYEGFQFLVHALELTISDETYLLNITTQLYPKLAEHFVTTPYCIDKNLRTVVTAVWEKGNHELFEQMAGYKITKRPSNGLFISILTEYLMECQYRLQKRSVTET